MARYNVQNKVWKKYKPLHFNESLFCPHWRAGRALPRWNTRGWFVFLDFARVDVKCTQRLIVRRADFGAIFHAAGNFQRSSFVFTRPVCKRHNREDINPEIYEVGAVHWDTWNKLECREANESNWSRFENLFRCSPNPFSNITWTFIYKPVVYELDTSRDINKRGNVYSCQLISSGFHLSKNICFSLIFIIPIEIYIYESQEISAKKSFSSIWIVWKMLHNDHIKITKIFPW